MCTNENTRDSHGPFCSVVSDLANSLFWPHPLPISINLGKALGEILYHII